jgi:DNA-binding transcriptional ArsR family regulator
MTYEIALDALGDSTRRLIFDRLCAGACSVAVLAEGLPVSRPAVSQHLKILKEAGLVTDQAVGVRRIYCVNRDGLAPLHAWLDGLRNGQSPDYQAEIQRQMDERKNT